MQISKIKKYVALAAEIINVTKNPNDDSPVIQGCVGDISCAVDSRTNTTTIKNKGNLVLKVAGKNYRGAFAHHGSWEYVIQSLAEQVNSTSEFERSYAATV